MAAVKYRLKRDAAPHWQKNAEGKEIMFKPGSLVESESNLHEMFPGKFDPPGVEEAELRETLKDKDEHIARLEAELAELRGSRQADFVQAMGDKPATKEVHEVPTAAIPSDDVTKQLAGQEGLDLELKEELGDDVSDKFPTAADGRMRVFHKGKQYTVVDEEGKELNFKSITRQEDVDDFIEKQIKKQEKERLAAEESESKKSGK